MFFGHKTRVDYIDFFSLVYYYLLSISGFLECACGKDSKDSIEYLPQANICVTKPV